MTSEVVKIFVGPNRERYNLHKALLCDRSRFFDVAFRSKFRESHEEVMNLPEESAEAFTLFVMWIYSSSLSIDGHFELHIYIELYGLAQKFCMEDLGNQAMDLIRVSFEVSRPPVLPSAVYWGYRLTSPGCGLRRFISGLMAHKFLEPHRYRLPESMLEEFVQLMVETEDLARDFVFALNENKVQRHALANCVYHEHRQTAPCTDAIARS